MCRGFKGFGSLGLGFRVWGLGLRNLEASWLEDRAFRGLEALGVQGFGVFRGLRASGCE